MRYLYRLARPFLFQLPPETAHRLALLTLKSGLLLGVRPVEDSRLAVRLWDLNFPNPVGLAAGFDKNAEVSDALVKLGFGFVEVGSLTPMPQTGNPPPRLFRLTEDEALINRLGFNNLGHAHALRRLHSRATRPAIVGVNLGVNRDSGDPLADYVKGVVAFNGVASYITINISSPNTPGLRDLQSPRELDRLLDRLAEARRRLAQPKPLLLKLAPDLSEPELARIAESALANGVDGLILGNTTVSRPPLKSSYASQQGGLSGAPLFEISTRKLAQLYRLTSGRMPLIGVGGVSSAEAAWQKIRAGASLIQLYSALIYQGPIIVRKICEGLAERLAASGKHSIAEITGTGVSDWL
jgi:dihydroorotate dehydrogenase